MATQLPVGYRASVTVASAGTPVWPFQYNLTPGSPAGEASFASPNNVFSVIGVSPGFVTLNVSAGSQSGSIELEITPTPLDITLGDPEPNT